MYHHYKEAVERGEDIGVVVRLAREAGTSAALTARTVLEEWLSAQREEGEGRVDDKVVKQQVRDSPRTEVLFSYRHQIIRQCAAQTVKKLFFRWGDL